ncbi:RNA-directed DNA polymerase, eukaryota [Artemisia annua]|uniref:RNA-directed DNA polymerase, eukaryota n=1 Tax=Artemisia annua TaxID=35608 RepID=A0A2U1P7X6_ARTAN|nr:RNA-directed DNA polymerase, eukaryota [Artemisia annua]
MVDWQEVPARRNKGRLHNKGVAKGFEDVTKFFVSNLPNGCIPGDVSEFLGCFGEVVSSYIARKRDKEGNKFGFVTFRKVSNTADLVKRMNGVKMGSCRLKVNVARFAMENTGRREVEEKEGRMHNTIPQVCRKQEEFVVEREKKVRHSQSVGMSFRDILEGKPSVPPSFQSNPSSKSIKVPDNVVAFFEIRGKSLVGRVRDLKTLTCINKILVEHGFAMEFLLKKDVWCLWFSALDLWDGQPMPFERVAWIKIHGVPINLAIDEVFDDIANQLGKIIHPSQLCLEEGDISTWITEETRVWDPECVVSVVKRKEESVIAVNHDAISLDLVHAPAPDSGVTDNEKVDDPMEEGEIRNTLHGEEVENQRLHGEFNGIEGMAAMEHNERDLNLGVGVGSFDKNLENIANVDLFNKYVDNHPKPTIGPTSQKLGKEPIECMAEESAEGPSVESNCNNIDVGDLDLNNPVHAPVSLVNSSATQYGGLDMVDNGVEPVAALDKEVEETVKIGVALGMDLAEHKDLVKNSIVVEGGSEKVPWLSKMKYNHGVEFLAVQETMDGDLSHFDGKRIWGNNNYVKEFLGSVGNLGGLLCMWDKSLFTQFTSIKNRYFLLVSGKLKGSNDIGGFEDAVCSAIWVEDGGVPPDVLLMKKFAQIKNNIKKWKVEMIKEGLSEEEEWIYVESKKILKELEAHKRSDIR